MIDIASIEFHTEMFHAGVNFGKKIGKGTPKDIPGIKIVANPEKTWVYFSYNGRTREIPVFGNVASWEVKSVAIPEAPKNEHQTHDVARIKSAQVSSPMGHVFEGPGKGKTKS